MSGRTQGKNTCLGNERCARACGSETTLRKVCTLDRDIGCARNVSARPPRVPLARQSSRTENVSLSREEAALVRAALCFDVTDAVSVTDVRKIVHVRFPKSSVCDCEMCYCFLGKGAYYQ